jgi:hypothetical protein
LGINNHDFIGEDAQKVADLFYPYYTEIISRIGRERGCPPFARQQFEYSRSPKGALMVVSVQQMIDKILSEYELFGYTRFMAHASLGTIPHAEVMKSIELYGTKVVPEVKKV